MEKFKAWLKENWVYVIGGVMTVGVAAAAIVNGCKADVEEEGE